MSSLRARILLVAVVCLACLAVGVVRGRSWVDFVGIAIVAVPFALLLVRDRLAPGFMAPDRRRDNRALLVFGGFVLAWVVAGIAVSLAG